MRTENIQYNNVYKVKQRFSNMDRNFKPKQTKEIFGIEFHPFGAFPDDACGTFEVHNVLSQYKMPTCLRQGYDLEELYNFFFEAKDYAIYTMDATEAELHKWNTLKTKLPVGNIKHVYIKSEYANSQQFLDFVKKFKEDNKVNLFAGNIETVECAERIIHAGADVVVIGGESPLSVVDSIVDVASLSDVKTACAHAFLNGNSLYVGVDFLFDSSYDGYEESGGRVEVHEDMTVKVVGDEYSIFRGSVSTKAEYHITELNKIMHHVGAKDIEHLPQRVIFLTMPL